ncbi:MAG: hypothetical protein GXO85_00080 [Chlorobi bacterium]|nr:hypothetical protein [Chlorobiota bacterium]
MYENNSFLTFAIKHYEQKRETPQDVIHNPAVGTKRHKSKNLFPSQWDKTLYTEILDKQKPAATKLFFRIYPTE